MGRCRGGLRMRRTTAHLGRRLVLAQTFVDDLAQQVFIRPGQILDLGDQLRLDPMHAAEHERRAKPACPRWRYVQWHIGHGERLQPAP